MGSVFKTALDPQRERIADGLHNLDSSLIDRIARYRKEADRDPQWLDRNFPVLPFRPEKPATFVYVHLVRRLVVDRGLQLKHGDGIDFCHAVIGASYATAMTLDTQWKDRIEGIPGPHKLAKVYGPNQLDMMIGDLENTLRTMGRM